MRHRLFLVLAAVWAMVPLTAIAAEGEKTPPRSSYVQISTLLGATIRSSGRHGVMSVDCGLDVPDETLRKRVEQSVPRLRAAYVQTIQTYAAGLGDGALPNPDYLGQTLQRQTDAILGRPGARLLLGGIIVN